MDHTISENLETLPDLPIGDAPASAASLRRDYHEARSLAMHGQLAEAEVRYRRVADRTDNPALGALARSDLAVLTAQAGEGTTARELLERALALDPTCLDARQNLEFLNRAFSESEEGRTQFPARSDQPQRDSIRSFETAVQESPTSDDSSNEPGIKVALLSFLFNWPSTGGGIVHTVELAKFLSQAGYAVEHFYVRYPEWGTGNVSAPFPVPSRLIDFNAASWDDNVIRERVRSAVRAFDPDYVIITDSWNSKPLLAEAVSEYPYLLRFQAMECLCPLNNVRLLPPVNGQFQQCRLNQLSHPAACRTCLEHLGQRSGSLHQAEREISGVSSADYHERLLAAFRNAEAVFVVNPLMEAIVAPYCRQVRVATAGMDPARFGNPQNASSTLVRSSRTRLLFAGLIEEGLKGFHVLHEACSRLWQKRQDFELVATGDPAGQVDAFTRFIGWQSQEELPRHLAECDVLMMPTVAQEALGRTAVEAMAAGRPVIASRLGGLAFTVRDGETGLLCQPGDVDDLMQKIETLLDHPELREQLGRAGRRCFEREYAWEGIIERHYRPILSRRRTRPAGAVRSEIQVAVSAAKPRREKEIGNGGGIHLSLIVTVLESYEVVRRQLRHLNGLLPPDCELILVDDGSRPSLEEVCDSIERNYAFRLLLTQDFRQWTQPRARNQAAAIAQGEKLLFFDIDHIITPEIIEAARQFSGDRMFWIRKPGILDERGQVVTDPVILRGHGVTEGMAEIHPNSFVIRRALFETLGGYDERFCGSYGGDDLDFNERYARLVELGLAKVPEVIGQGYVYPNPSINGGRTFHSLERTVANREPVAT